MEQFRIIITLAENFAGTTEATKRFSDCCNEKITSQGENPTGGNVLMILSGKRKKCHECRVALKLSPWRTVFQKKKLRVI
jgi:hypothetical protein